MPLSKTFKNTVMTRAKKDKAFCNAMLSEAINELIAGDLTTGKAILRDYINATISFEILSVTMEKNPKSIMRMLSPSGNPSCRALHEIFLAIQKIKRTKIRVSCK